MAKQRREYPDPGPRPENVTPQELERWRVANEKFLTEGAQRLPAERPKIDHTDERLRALKKEHEKYLERVNPFTDALWLALLRTEADTIFDEEMSKRYRTAIETGSKEVVDTPRRLTIVAIASQLATKAMRGDVAAISQIAERIEGKTGLRRGDVDPDDPARERKTRAIVEDAVRALTDKRIRETAPDITDVKFKEVAPAELEEEK